jgi:lipopolysaccharide transport system permease protein
LVECFRWALLGTGPAPWPVLSVSLLSMLILIPVGLVTFQRMERSFADVI